MQLINSYNNNIPLQSITKIEDKYRVAILLSNQQE